MWYEKFDSHIRQLGYRRTNSDPCFYVKRGNDEKSRIYLIFYVDDMLIAGKDRAAIAELKRKLHEKFSMKELGDARHILGMHIERELLWKTLRLSQQDYEWKVLRIFNMKNVKLARTPLTTSIRTTDKASPSTVAEREQMKGIPYASAVGSLMYAIVATRLDLAYAVGVLSRYMANLGKRH